MKVTAFADGLRARTVKEHKPQESWSCCLLRRGRGQREGQVAGMGGQEEGSEAPLGSCTETIGHLDGDVDSLVGNKIFLGENSLGWRASCRRCGRLVRCLQGHRDRMKPGEDV